MLSMNTNSAAMVALQTLRATTAGLNSLQSETATGLRIAEASHNAAYWSISVAMQSDVQSIGAIKDALGLSAALTDVTYSAITEVESLVSQVKQKIVLAQQDGVDRAKIQTDISQLARQAETAVNSASFAGTNLLAPSGGGWDNSSGENTVELLTSYVRGSDGISLGTKSVDLSVTALSRPDGSGLFRTDPRSPRTLGGIRAAHGDEIVPNYFARSSIGGHGRHQLEFRGPFSLGVGESLSFDITVDADSPNHGLPEPLDPGVTTTITISRADIDARFPRANGTITDWKDMTSLLSRALSDVGAYAALVFKSSYAEMGDGLIKYTGQELVDDAIIIGSLQSSGRDGSSVVISSISGPSTGGLEEFEVFGSRSGLNLHFEPFKIFHGVEATMTFKINDGPEENIRIDRDTIDRVLETDDGSVKTVEQMVTLLEHFIARPGLIIKADGDYISIRTDVETDRRAGSKSRIGFSDVKVNIEPLPPHGLLDMDIEANPGLLDEYLAAIDVTHAKIVSIGAYIGALKSHVDTQLAFQSAITDAIDRGIGQLADAEMDKVSARLQAEQVRQQLAIEALSISNSSPQLINQLFQ